MTVDTVYAILTPRNGPPGMVYASTHKNVRDAWVLAVAMTYGLNVDYEKHRTLMRHAGYRARRVRIVLDDETYFKRRTP